MRLVDHEHAFTQSDLCMSRMIGAIHQVYKNKTGNVASVVDQVVTTME